MERDEAELIELIDHMCDDEDAKQEAFARLLRPWRTGWIKPEMQTHYIRRAIKHCRIDAGRARNRQRQIQRRLGELAWPRSAASPLDELLRRETREVVGAAVFKLPTSPQQMVRQMDLAGKSAAEVARESGMREPAVRGRRHRGRSLLRSLIPPEFAEP